MSQTPWVVSLSSWHDSQTLIGLFKRHERDDLEWHIWWVVSMSQTRWVVSLRSWHSDSHTLKKSFKCHEHKKASTWCELNEAPLGLVWESPPNATNSVSLESHELNDLQLDLVCQSPQLASCSPRRQCIAVWCRVVQCCRIAEWCSMVQRDAVRTSSQLASCISSEHDLWVGSIFPPSPPPPSRRNDNSSASTADLGPIKSASDASVERDTPIHVWCCVSPPPPLSPLPPSRYKCILARCCTNVENVHPEKKNGRLT